MPQTVLAIATGRLGREMLRRDDSYEGGLSGDDPNGPAGWHHNKIGPPFVRTWSCREGSGPSLRLSKCLGQNVRVTRDTHSSRSCQDLLLACMPTSLMPTRLRGCTSRRWRRCRTGTPPPPAASCCPNAELLPLGTLGHCRSEAVHAEGGGGARPHPQLASREAVCAGGAALHLL